MFLGTLISFRLCMAVVLVTLAVSPGFGLAKTVDELREELQEKKDSLETTKERIEKFKADITQKRQEARTLADQIGLIDDGIQETELNISKTEIEIEKTALEIETVAEELRVKEEEILHQKRLLSEYIRSLYSLDQQSTVTVMLKYDTFSEAISESATIAELQVRAQATLVAIQNLHEELVIKRRELEDFRQALEELKTRQQLQQNNLLTQRNSKERILSLTNAQEAEYQKLLQEAQSAHKAAQASITALDEQIREELRKQGYTGLSSVGYFDWPIEPVFGVSCEFQCAGYPYAYLIGPHSAIDIPAYVGTPIQAPADGYVAKVFDSGNTNYSYILIIHGDNLSTVYGHVSGFAVNEGQTVLRGTVIGYTGGAPGSRGAGLSTGPHLHFEVRQNGIPINPRNFLLK